MVRLKIDECRIAVQIRFRVSPDVMMCRRHLRCAVHPRQLAMVLARDVGGHTTTEIGRYFGKHHTTVVHAGRAVARRCARDSAYREDVEQLKLTLAVYAAQKVNVL